MSRIEGEIARETANFNKYQTKRTLLDNTHNRDSYSTAIEVPYKK